MATQFPGTAIDSFTNPSASSKTNSPSLSAGQSNQNDAIVAIETKLGIDNSANTNSHDYKIKHKTDGLYRARVYLSGGQNIATSSEAKVLLDTVDYDSNSNFDSVTNHRYTAPVTGYYLITGRASTVDGNGVDGTRWFSILYKNGSRVGYGGGYFAGISLISPFITEILFLAAGDYIELYALQFTGVTIGIHTGSDFTSLAIHLLST